MKFILGLLIFLAMSSTQVLASDWKRLVNPAELSALLQQDPDVVVIDIRAASQFAKGHIAGARNAPYGSWRGPKANPGQVLDDRVLTERLQSLGINPDDRVVVTYHGKDATDFGAAARVYWTLKSAGLTEIAILNGGLAEWITADKPMTRAIVEHPRSTALYTMSHEWMVDRAEVANVVSGRSKAVAVDARPVNFWRGKKKHKMASRAGTLPNALQLTHSSWFTQAPNKVSMADEVKAIAVKAGYAPGSKRALISFCNTGHWAATNWFALSEVAGIEGVKLYPESMVGWANSGGTLTTGK